jgi:hypothetical protein
MAGGWRSRLGLLVGGACLCAITGGRAEGQDGPAISFFGIASPDGSPASASSVDDMGRDVFERLLGHSFFLVIEARPGEDGFAVGAQTFAYEPGNVSLRPDLQALASLPLGNGNPAVCALGEPGGDGVPGIDPPAFADTQEVTDALSDLGCRFINDNGQTVGRPAARACTVSAGGSGVGFVAPGSTIQFCAFIPVSIAFASSETTITARARDVQGNLGEERQIVLRVTGPTPTVTPTVTPTGTVTPTPTVTPLPCAGDCDRNGTVSANELIVAVDLALRGGDVARCRAADADGNGVITIDELTAAVASALGGCGG